MGAGERLVPHGHARPPRAEPGSGAGCEKGKDLAYDELCSISSASRRTSSGLV
jgi:hypothetical protein